MLEINDADARLLERAVKEGNAVLLLGAGASANCQNAKGAKVKLGTALAHELAEMSGLPYSNEDLPEVLEAVLGSKISAVQFHDLLRQEYSKVTPSPELIELFKYSWRRVYTWNIDDAVENIRSGVQIPRYFNGLKDKVAVYEGIEYLQIVHLHGEAIKPEHGFIFSQADYNARLNRDQHDWYRQAAADYASNVPIFIGSRLKEPILAAELDRARPNADAQLGRAFVVTPDDFTPLQKAAFEARNIVIVKGYLSDFVKWLDVTVGKEMTPLAVSQTTNSFTNALVSRIRPTRTEVDTANSIILHTWLDTKSKGDELQGLQRRQTARAFLEGAPPTWKLATTDIPVWLKATDALYDALVAAIVAKERMFLAYGQSGSGKTTALLQALLKFMRDHEGQAVYELKGDVKSLRSSLDLIHRLHKDDHAIVYVGDAFIYGDALGEDILAFPNGSLTLVSSARSKEWRQHIERRIGDFTTSFQYQRFEAVDFPALIDRLLQYVPAPTFLMMSSAERLRKLGSSQDQLLIALKETTASEKFTKVITDEYERLPNYDCKMLFLIVGLATIARTGISKSAANEAYNKVRRELSFEGALRQLEGIVSMNSLDRYVARHELYVRHIIENVADFSMMVDAAVETLRTYTKYGLPVVKHVDRPDALLFKFILNHNFIGELARRRNELEEGLRLYETFEVEFQLDGHFWLQFGQYLVMVGELEQALDVLQKSIAAYPDNVFAVHALADLQLRVAYRRTTYDAETVKLVGDAMETLEKLHASQIMEADFYPIVTLADKYVGALVKHGQGKSARAAAQRYFGIIDNMRRDDDQLARARERLARYLTHEIWETASSNDNGGRVGRHSRGRRRHKKGE